MIFAVTGRGRTAKGCLEVIDNLPVTYIKVAELEALWADRKNVKHRYPIYNKGKQYTIQVYRTT